MSKYWDIYYLKIAREVSKQSKCLSRQIGSVLVKNNSIIGSGYNGPASGIKHCNERDFVFYDWLNENTFQKKMVKDYSNGCPRRAYGYGSGKGTHLCQAGHAERNALIQCAKNGIATLNASLYCYAQHICKDCLIEIINAGVKELIFLQGEEYDKYSTIILKESKLIVRTYKIEEL